jgi:hypothetical protein
MIPVHRRYKQAERDDDVKHRHPVTPATIADAIAHAWLVGRGWRDVRAALTDRQREAVGAGRCRRR